MSSGAVHATPSNDHGGRASKPGRRLAFLAAAFAAVAASVAVVLLITGSGKTVNSTFGHLPAWLPKITTPAKPQYEQASVAHPILLEEQGYTVHALLPTGSADITAVGPAFPAYVTSDVFQGAVAGRQTGSFDVLRDSRRCEGDDPNFVQRLLGRESGLPTRRRHDQPERRRSSSHISAYWPERDARGPFQDARGSGRDRMVSPRGDGPGCVDLPAGAGLRVRRRRRPGHVRGTIRSENAVACCPEGRRRRRSSSTPMTDIISFARTSSRS